MAYTPNNAPIGVKVVQNNFRKVDRDIIDKAHRVVLQSAVEIASIAQQLAPKGDPANDRPSRTAPILSESIEVVDSGDKISVEVRAPHAGYVERGTRYQDSQPYLRPAVNAVRQRANMRLGHVRAGLGQDLGGNVKIRRR